ncbi:MAG: serine/threonine-protein kinase [Acidimicrobiales bacterium]
MADEEGTDRETARMASTVPTAVGPPAPDDTSELERAIVGRSLGVPAHIGRYRVERRIGVGGFASVFAAVDPELDAPVAIKVLADNHSADVEIRRRFVAEARVARKLGNDRLIGVYDLGETDDGRPFVVMELADRGTLRGRVIRLGPAPTADLRRLVDELGACMAAIHSKGVIHRDIKPTNLLLRSTGAAPAPSAPDRLIGDDERLVLADFGLARDISAGASAMTVGGGTAGYMAPEQADPSGQADHRADLYAATVVVAELATGRHPERLDLGASSLSSAILDVIGRGLSMDRELRPADAAEWRQGLLDALDRSGDDTGPAARHAAATVRAARADGGRADPVRGAADPVRPSADPSDTGTSDSAPDTGRTDAGTDLTRRIDDTRVLEVDRTRVQAPFPYDGNLERDSFVAPEPRSFVAPVEVTPPPPPPSIPLNPRVQRPTPPPSPALTPAQLPTARSDRTRPRPVAPVPAAPPPPTTAPPPSFAAAQPMDRTPAVPPPTADRSSTARPLRWGQARPAGAPIAAPPPGIAVNRPVTPSRPGPTAAPRPVAAGPASVPIRPGVLPRAEQRARMKAGRRWARRRRRHLRRVRAANLVRTVFRAGLGLLLTLVITTVLALGSSGAVNFEQLTPGAKSAVLLATALGTLLSIAVFPWPRNRRPDPDRIGPPPPTL